MNQHATIRVPPIPLYDGEVLWVEHRLNALFLRIANEHKTADVLMSKEVLEQARVDMAAYLREAFDEKLK